MNQHIYLSTACIHNEHNYCSAMTGHQGEKRPAKCKFCEAKCICECHNELDVTPEVICGSIY